ncbi:MAG: methyltransferase domain-containing protein [Calditrichaeota bacterium]|nr:methyltransferase domain-containing protein [Calditrichota bacterium]
MFSPHKHWKFKAALQKLLWSLPGGVGLNAAVSRLSAGHDPEQELFRKHAPNFFRHLAALKQSGFALSQEKSFLEIGTGWDVDVALLARLTGFGRVVTSDAFRHLNIAHVESSLTLFPRLLSEICEHNTLSRERVEELLSTAQAARGAELCERMKIEYVAPVSPSYEEFQDGSFDVIYSTAVFEHMYRKDALETLKQIRRLLSPGGLTTHIIDLKDHFAYFQSGLTYHNFLSMSERQWSFWAGNPLAHTNRLLVSDWEKLFREAGLEIVFLNPCEETDLPRLPRERLAAAFRDRSERDLTVGEIHVIARAA